MPPPDRSFCSDISADSGDSLAGTASRVDHWLLVEYRGVWNPDALAGSGLSDQVKRHLREHVRALRPAKLLFIRRRERRKNTGFTVFRVTTGSDVARFEVEQYEQLLELDLAGGGTPLDHPLILVCTHGKHDRCCAVYGRPLYEVLADQADEDWVWQTTHVGGDRFAGNVVVLPEGLYYGRVRPEEAWALIDEHLSGRIYLPRFRGRSTVPFRLQAAEIAVRERYGLAGVAPPAFSSEHDGAIELVLDGRRFEVELEVVPGPLTYLTCGAESLRHPPRYVVESLRESGA